MRLSQYLSKLDTDENTGAIIGRMAIISYRTATDAKLDAFTLSVEAFLSAIERAQECGIDWLWLDAWAYRRQPP